MKRRDFLTATTVTLAANMLSPVFAQTGNQYYSRFWAYPFCGYDGQPVRGGLFAQTQTPVTQQEALIATEEFNKRNEDFKTLFENLYRLQKTEQGMTQIQSQFQKLLDEVSSAINARAGRGVGIEVSPLPFQPQPDLKCTLG